VIECIKEHLQHIRHIELEASTLLGFYGVFLVWVIQTKFYGLAFGISLVFLLIMIKLNLERKKHWNAIEKFGKEISDKKIQECIQELFPVKGFLLKGLLLRLIGVFRLIITLLLGLTIYFFIYMLPPWINIYWRELLVVIIAVVYWLLSAIQSWKEIERKRKEKN
jgi:hypothetical protein